MQHIGRDNHQWPFHNAFNDSIADNKRYYGPRPQCWHCMPDLRFISDGNLRLLNTECVDKIGVHTVVRFGCKVRISIEYYRLLYVFNVHIMLSIHRCQNPQNRIPQRYIPDYFIFYEA